MSRPVAIRRIIIELNINNLEVLREALLNYNEYLQKALEFDWSTSFKLSKGAIKRRIKYTEDFLDSLELE